ncbi:MAG: hypothetical protein IKT07_01970 [Oscillospiraceae bacterium]|nr:hypothetical protein [Oscillospiraceae bacterium]
MPSFEELLREKNNFVFIGETGSGKSEIALNVAVMLTQRKGCTVHLFDLDQTKAMFRSRDAESDMKERGVTIHYMPQLLDTPVLVPGIIPHLIKKDSLSVLDVGGNENAARMVGCLSDYLNGESTAAFYILNPYRPWSGSVESIRDTMTTVLNACHIDKVFFAANPTIGLETTAEDIASGLDRVLQDIPAEELTGIFVREDLLPELIPVPGLCYLPLQPYLIYPWQRK